MTTNVYNIKQDPQFSTKDRVFRDRKFTERANLTFIFKRTDNDTESFKVIIPLFENPEINESKQARLGKYKPIGRNSNLYSFLGADSTILNLNFYMTLPHMRHYSKDIALTKYVYSGKSLNDPKNEFRLKQKTDNKVDSLENVIKILESFEDDYAITSAPEETLEDKFNENTAPVLGVLASLFAAPTAKAKIRSAFAGTNTIDINEDWRAVQLDPDFTKVKTLYYFWLNIIRCSVIGTSDKKSPPPIVRFNYGSMFKRVPFVIEKYQISIDEKAGYDVATLLPNRLKISLQMEELRVGNFGEFIPYGLEKGTLETGENVAGWEYIREHGSIQPVYTFGGN